MKRAAADPANLTGRKRMGRRGERARRSETRGQRSEAVESALSANVVPIRLQGCGVSVSVVAAFTVFPLARTASSIFFSLVASGS